MASALIQFRDEKLDQQFAERTTATPLMVQARTEKLPTVEERKKEESERSRLFSTVAERDLDRYYYLLSLTLAKLSFTEGEAMLMVDVFNGTMFMPYSISLLWAEISDALEEGYAEKWKVDGPALVAKLRNLTPFECMAVADAVERVWNSETYQVTNMEEKVRVVGLVRDEKVNSHASR